MESFYLLSFEGQKVVSFAQEQLAKGKIDLAKEACDYAQSLGLSSLCPDIDSASLIYTRKAERKLIELLPNTSTDHEVQMVADVLVASSRQASQVSNYAKSLRKLVRGRDILHPKKQENPTLCRDLGLALAHFGKWEEADSVYRRGLELQLALDPSSELALQLNNGVVEAYYQSAKWQEAVAVCKYALDGWSRTSHTFEMLRTVYFLVSSYYYLEQHMNGFALADAWQGAGVDSADSECVLRLIQAEKMRLQKSQGALAFNEQAVAQSMQQLPSSFMTAQALRNLGRIYEAQQQLQQTEECYLQACQIFSMHFPHSFSYAQCLENCGYLYQNLVNRPDQAEKCYKDAYDILKQHYAETKAFAYCLLNLGLLSAGKGRKEEASQELEMALELHRKMGDQENAALCESALSGLRG
jgi:tetratricopeptide (TPR) repeat protein